MRLSFLSFFLVSALGVRLRNHAEAVAMFNICVFITVSLCKGNKRSGVLVAD